MIQLSRNGSNLWLLLIVSQCFLLQFQAVDSTNGVSSDGCIWTGCQDEDADDAIDCSTSNMFQIETRDCGEDGTNYHCCPASMSPKDTDTDIDMDKDSDKDTDTDKDTDEDAEMTETATKATKPMVTSTVQPPPQSTMKPTAQPIVSANEPTKAPKSEPMVTSTAPPTPQPTSQPTAQPMSRSRSGAFKPVSKSSVARTSNNPSTAGTDQSVAMKSVENDSGCWWTGCQKNDWAVVGCGQYNMTEKSNRNCQDGKEYNCCPRSSNSISKFN
ncbi:uncharacterized protein LOC128391364 [Panonychus citri]|uniref:uncharacterized protein LOC128391364 n=1 Tax=Panonychus citri TaxID=50023 RepID=UPI00230744FB|nr:uncharacterized protein LOC128391364 [Panonychus citri]